MASPGNPVRMSLKVVDAITGDALIGARVAIEGTDIVLYTNPDGEVTIEALDLDVNADLNISYISYEAQSMDMDDLSPSGLLKLTPR